MVSEKKIAYDKRFCELLQKFDKAFLVNADNVGSKQMADIRASLRDNCIILFGKNTMLRRALRSYAERTGDDRWSILIPSLVGNVGFIFTDGSFDEIVETLGTFTKGAAAKSGSISPVDVTIEAGNTGMDPSQTSFFQALNIPTKINRGTVEIVENVQVLSVGDKVGTSEAALLAKMGMKPFTYGLKAIQVFDNGSVFDPKVLDITDDDLIASAQAAIRNIAAFSFGANYPTVASIPHSIINGYKNILSVAIETEITFPLAEKVKAILSDPEAFAAAQAAAAAAAAPAGGAAAAVVEEEEEEEEEEMEFDLFD